MARYKILFKGYRRDQFREGLPESSGVYSIYRCIYNKTKKTVSLKELFYIGQSINIRQEICNHKRRDEFLAEARVDEQICYAYAEVPQKQLDVVENALIFMQKPRLNNNLVDHFNHGDVELEIEGKTALLKKTHFQIVKNND